MKLSFLLFLSTYVNYQIPSSLENQVRAAIEAYNAHEFILENIDKHGYLELRSVDYGSVIPPVNCKISLEFKLLDSLIFPLDGYSLYEIRYNPDKLICRETVTEIFSTHNPTQSRKSYLVGYNHRTEQVIYIFGDFMKHRISRYFDFENTVSISKFIKYKFYNLSLKKLTFVKENKNIITFTGYSELWNREVNIEISKNDHEQVKVL